MIFAGIFLISTGILALQILQTRIFSFTLWHHLAYMVITIALMGMSAGGTFLAIRSKKSELPWRFASICSLLFSVTTLISLAIVTRIPLDTFMEDKILQLSYVFLYYMALIFPYFFAGVIISFIFKHIREKINIYYLSNLFGSAIGGFAILAVMETLGGEGAALVVVFLGLIAAACFAMAGRHGYLKYSTVVLTVILIAAYPFRLQLFPVSSPSSKALGSGYALDKDQKIEYTNWDRVARIDVFSNKRSQEFFNYFPELKNKIITIDGDAYTLLYDFPSVITGSYKDYPKIGESLYASAYLVHENPKVLVVGLGGGTDIIEAIYHDAVSVTGVEINSAMIDVTKNQFSSYVGSPYQYPSVNIVHSEGRSYIRRVQDKFDIIQMSGVDTWTALSTGAYVMSESYIYTSDAIKEYLSKLNDDGTLSIIRWQFWPPREMLRLCTEAVFVLRSMGIENPEKNVVVIGDGSLASILVKKRPFTWTELVNIEESVKLTPKNRIIYAPGFEAPSEYYKPIFAEYKNPPISLETGVGYIKNSYSKYFSMVEQNKESEFINAYEYNIEPVSDDNPFFFRYYKWKHVFSGEWGRGGSFVDSMPVGLAILLLSLLQSVIFSLLLIVLPLFFLKTKERAFSPLMQIIYFSMIGVGFMFIEISIIQQFVLFLGNPADAIAITIMILLIFTGFGALFSKKLLITWGERRIYKTLAIVFPLAILGYAYLIPWFTHAFLDSAMFVRVLISFILLAPLGACLGLFFPIGLTIVGEKNESFIPWAFATNGVASTVSSILSIMLAMVYGFTFVFTMAAFCYFIAAVTFYRFAKKHI